MKTRSRIALGLTLALGSISFGTASQAEDKGSSSDQAKMMAKMVELGQPGPNHKLLADLVGTWESKATFQMAPGAPPTVSIGTAVRKPAMDGRYFITDTTAKMDMPGPDGKMQSMDYQGMEIEGYDNVKGKFFATWIDSMGTSLLLSEGTYDPASKTFTYHLDEEMAPGKHTKVRETLKVLDKDHYVFDWYEDHGGKEAKTMEVTYARK